MRAPMLCYVRFFSLKSEVHTYKQRMYAYSLETFSARNNSFSLSLSLSLSAFIRKQSNLIVVTGIYTAFCSISLWWPILSSITKMVYYISFYSSVFVCLYMYISWKHYLHKWDSLTSKITPLCYYLAPLSNCHHIN